MKQSARALGVAVLGAAFAASAAGSAAAAGPLPIGTPLDTVSNLTGAAKSLPLENVTKLLGTVTEDGGLPVAPSAVTGLLGGLPVGGSLPAAGLG
ncbi:hypothetical protein NX801_18995 [Streptomyces sp. LP05-1]|uniref:Secreted protein n=1 Tax=Streptomyces pyxinae TaxID=2970734 RepID=A0ABT2CMB4_9ACTN|nr:hypothetical protein [Streptomyces sp. LP05-1]MCS0637714.1 hypothetical protein [Streptomyces sp. LP05-1]